MSMMNERDLAEFQVDVRVINWRRLVHDYGTGIRRYSFKEDCMPPEAGFNQILA